MHVNCFSNLNRKPIMDPFVFSIFHVSHFMYLIWPTFNELSNNNNNKNLPENSNQIAIKHPLMKQKCENGNRKFRTKTLSHLTNAEIVHTYSGLSNINVKYLRRPKTKPFVL